MTEDEANRLVERHRIACIALDHIATARSRSDYNSIDKIFLALGQAEDLAINEMLATRDALVEALVKGGV